MVRIGENYPTNVYKSRVGRALGRARIVEN